MSALGWPGRAPRLRLRGRWAATRPDVLPLEYRVLPATFTVNSFLDGVVANPGGGTALTADGRITLRSAIQELNAEGGFGNIILPAGAYTLSPPGTPNNPSATGDLAITAPITVQGAGLETTTIQGDGSDRIFDVQTSNRVTFQNMTLTGGRAATGGAVLSDQGSLLELDNVALIGNTTTGDGGALAAVAKGTFGQLTLKGVLFQNNTAGGLGGGMLLDGLTALVDGATFAGNTGSQGGGGIEVEDLHATGIAGAQITRATFSGNTTTGNGGGIELTTGHLSVTDATFTLNSAATRGGGIDVTGSLTVGDDILAKNSAPVGPDVFGAFNSQGFNLVGNKSSSDGVYQSTDIVGDPATPIDPLLSPLVLHGGSFPVQVPLPGSPVIGKGQSFSSVDERGAGRPTSGTDIGAVQHLAYAIASLSDGTHGAISTSFGSLKAQVTEGIFGLPGVAIGFDVPATGPSGTFPGGAPHDDETTDVNGIATSATYTANNVVGSYSVGASVGTLLSVGIQLTNNPVVSTFTVNSGTDGVDANPGGGTALTSDGRITLRSAIQELNAVGGGTIILPAGIYTLSLVGPNEDLAATGDLDIRAPITIQGGGAGSTVIRGDGSDRIFDILTNGNVKITNVTMEGGNVTDVGGAVRSDSGAQLELDNDNLFSNSATSGGALEASGAAGQVVLSSVLFFGNTSVQDGGAVLIDGAALDGTGVVFETNSATASGARGGAVAVLDTAHTGHAAVQFRESVFFNDSASAGSGGGLFVDAGTKAAVFDSTIYNCHGNGAGINIATGGNLRLGNSIVAHTDTPSSPDIVGAVASTSGFDLIGDADGATGFDTTTLRGTTAAPLDPLLGTEFVGTTAESHALFYLVPVPGSAAISHGQAFGPTDQRGTLRPTPTATIGAVEPLTFAITSTSGGQHVTVGQPFNTLLAHVTENGFDISGAVVSFAAPTSGPSGTFTGNPTVTTDVSGMVAAPTFTANFHAGSYNVRASLSPTTFVDIALTNDPGNFSFTVNSFADGVDASPGSGTALTSDGRITLRSAIQELNALGGGTINLPAGNYALSIAGPGEDLAATGDLDILQGIIVKGAGSGTTIIHGDGSDRIFDVVTTSFVAIQGVTLTGGNSDAGGAIRGAAGVNLGLGDVRLTGNHSTGDGGAINVVGAASGGQLLLNGVLIQNNTAGGFGGGVFVDGLTALVDSVTIADNSATAGGGGAAIVDSLGTGLAGAVVTRTTLLGNSTPGVGGAVLIQSGNVQATDTTVAFNMAAFGGGIANNAFLAGGNNIVAKNTAPTGPDILGSYTSQGFNLIGDATGATGTLLGSDLIGTSTAPIDPLLSPLVLHGGNLPVLVLEPGSPAIGKGQSAQLTDERGVARPTSGVDIGAVQHLVFAITSPSGGQHANVGATFGVLQAIVTEGGFLLPGAAVTFNPPAFGPGGTFASSPTVTTDTTGTATAPAFTANSQAGSYNVRASLSPTTFADIPLVNDPAATHQFFVHGPTSVPAGQSFSITILAQDSNGNPLPSFVGAVNLTSNDPLFPPQMVVFGTADNGVRQVDGLVLSRAGQFTITATATDGTTGSLLVGVTSVGPSGLNLSLDHATITEGSAVSLTGSFGDPNPLAPHTVRIDWGDGTITAFPLAAGVFQFQVPHTYATPPHNGSSFPIGVSVLDSTNGEVDGATAVTVTNTAPVLQRGTPVVLDTQGSTFTQTFTFNDPGLDHFTATVDYGDGTGPQPVTVNGRTITLSHVYTTEGTFKITLTLQDGFGGTDTLTEQAAVLLPGTSGLKFIVVPPGQTATITIGGATITFSNLGGNTPAIVLLGAINPANLKGLKNSPANDPAQLVAAFEIRVIAAGPDSVLTATLAFPNGAAGINPTLLFFDKAAGAFVPVVPLFGSASANLAGHLATFSLGRLTGPTVAGLIGTVFTLSVPAAAPTTPAPVVSATTPFLLASAATTPTALAAADSSIQAPATTTGLVSSSTLTVAVSAAEGLVRGGGDEPISGRLVNQQTLSTMIEAAVEISDFLKEAFRMWLDQPAPMQAPPAIVPPPDLNDQVQLRESAIDAAQEARTVEAAPPPVAFDALAVSPPKDAVVAQAESRPWWLTAAPTKAYANGDQPIPIPVGQEPSTTDRAGAAVTAVWLGAHAIAMVTPEIPADEDDEEQRPEPEADERE
jgi:predicted outer membrane repeat protein